MNPGRLQTRVVRARVAGLGLIIFVLAALAGRGDAAAKTDARAEATRAAQAWLALVDAAKYDESWDAAAKIFQAGVTREQWRAAAAAARAPLGVLGARAVKSTKLMTSLPGAPDGRYVVIQFKTSFAHKKAAVETVTPMQEADGAWKVSGYFVR